jgi:hypothetical protein
MWELNNTLKEKYCDSTSDVNAGITMCSYAKTVLKGIIFLRDMIFSYYKKK